MAVRRDDPIRIEAQALGELAALHASPVFWGRGVPRGDGRLVVAVPGLFGNDVYLRPLRRAIQRLVEDAVSERILYKAFRAGEIIIVDTEDDPDNEGQKRICFRSIEGFQPPTIEPELAAAAPGGPIVDPGAGTTAASE